MLLEPVEDAFSGGRQDSRGWRLGKHRMEPSGGASPLRAEDGRCDRAIIGDGVRLGLAYKVWEGHDVHSGWGRGL